MGCSVDRKSKILILDDEAEVGEILGVLLEEQFDCETFTDAALALNALKSGDFPVIITDLEMPHFNGVEFVKKVRLQNCQSSILISTGHDSSHPMVQEALKGGANGVLPKPFLDPESLIACIMSSLS